MELCSESLKEIIQIINGEFIQNLTETVAPFRYFIARELFIEILEAVNFLHKRNPPIIHKNLKPTNILITNGNNGRSVKLADIRLAAIDELISQSSVENAGNSDYSAPEILRTDKYDTKADIYSLGMIARQLFNIDMKRLSGINSTLKKKYLEIDNIIHKMISDDINLRPNCDQILTDRQSWALDLQILKRLPEIQLNELKPSEKSFYSNFIQVKFKSHIFMESRNDLIPNGKYEREFIEISSIGEGSYGKVFKVKHKTTQEIFAIKKILVIDENDSLKELVACLHIIELYSHMTVRYYDVWFENVFIAKNVGQQKTLNSIIYIQIELCEKALNEVISKIQNYKELKSNDLLNLLGFYITSQLYVEILEGVDFLHKEMIIHRDLKPGNILLTNGIDGRFVKLADFGLAKVLQKVKPNTNDVGTRKYMAPEVESGDDYDFKADIYSLGVIMKEMFNIKFSKSYNEQINNSPVLLSKYKNVKEFVENMMQPNSAIRPDCDKILDNRNLWALSKTEFDYENELRSLQEPVDENYFVYYMINSKLLV